MKRCVGVADTTFSRVDMGSIAIEVLERELPGYSIKRYTVPGIKDLPGAAKRLIDSGCEGVITLGWVGREPVDKYSYIASSIGLIMVEILTGKIVIDVTVHEDEAKDPMELKRIAVERAKDHARNLALLLKEGPTALSSLAGKGVRQGYPDVGPL
ncbi:MAG: riboflavin synthase [Desulfurococcales archaeon]|nr:riboflavin synthase [Desulfurococcales archaeon]MEB3779306.1 riboflavin synthase [Desulfurococcales archaeon]